MTEPINLGAATAALAQCAGFAKGFKDAELVLRALAGSEQLKHELSMAISDAQARLNDLTAKVAILDGDVENAKETAKQAREYAQLEASALVYDARIAIAEERTAAKAALDKAEAELEERLVKIENYDELLVSKAGQLEGLEKKIAAAREQIARLVAST